MGGINSRADLRQGMTRLGGPGCDVVIPGAPEGELHVWTDPPKVIRISGRAELEVNGRSADEALLENGQSIRWGGVVMTFRSETPVLQEIRLPEPKAGPAPALDPKSKSLQRVQAGLAIDLGMVPKPLVQRWQEAVLQQVFDADACAREALAQTDKFALDDPRVIERSGLLLRDFLMASLQRGVSGDPARARRAEGSRARARSAAPPS